MDIETKALNFAINAHKGQVRKGDIDYPMVLHPIDVANILKEYGFDKNVIAAGYLHDVIEDTEYTKEDLNKIFSQDVVALVMFATEEDKSLSWEERKQITIDKIVNGDIRHKAVVCADKISNLEDIANIIGKNQNNSLFDRFNAGFEKQKWYYENIYQSLIFNEDASLPMFVRLRNLIDIVFCGKKEENFVEINNIYKDEYYLDLLKLYYKSKELLKLKGLIKNTKPYVIELAGTPRAGKTKLLNNLIDFFVKAGFKCDFVEEFTKTKKYKDYYFSKWKNKSIPFVNFKIYENVLKEIDRRLLKNVNIILSDRGLVDRLIWINRLYLNGKIEKSDYIDLEDKIWLESKNKIDIIIAMYADVGVALLRDYENNLSLEKRSFLNKRRVEEYNNALENIEKVSKEKNINFWKVDTSNLNKREVSIYIANILLDDMGKYYLDQVKKDLGYM
jgi:guanosine-3',5'-bis(diphosphate) 3'-pyrophosphohydrolase